MSETRHTPGPWSDTGRFGFGRYIRGGAGESVCVTHNAESDEGEANAHLIAAAPDLLDVCRAVVTAYGGNHFLGYTEKHLLDGAKAAIAKAEGR